MIQFHFLGGVSVSIDGTPVTGRAIQPRRVAALAVLAASPRCSTTRDRLVALLWPETSTRKGRKLLATSLYEIRQALGADALITSGDQVALAPDRVRCDVGRFRAAARHAPEEAVELYRGPFLDGFHLRGSHEFDEWLEGERRELAARYAAALREAAADRENAGDRMGAIQLHRRLARHDPADARVARSLMETLVDAGDRAGALEHARHYAAEVQERFGLVPDPEILAYAERIREHGVSAEEAHLALAGRDEGSEGIEVEASDAAEGALLERESIVGAGERIPRTEPEPNPAGRYQAEQEIRDAPARPRRGQSGDPRAGVEPGRRPVTAVVVLLIVGAFGYAGFDYVVAADPRGPGDPEIRSLVVLPLENLAADPEAEEYFADGMTEALTAELGRISALTVKSRTSATRYRETDKATPVIARELGVEALIEGSVLRSGDKVRVTLQLVHGPTDRQMWSASYERDAGDVLALQGEVARAVAEELEITLTPSEEARLAARRVVQPEAYRLWLRGNVHLQRLTEESFHRALRLYEQALVIDPDFAPAHAGVAMAYIHLGSWFVSEPLPNFLPRAKEAVARALQLDSTQADTHLAQGLIRFWGEWDWTGADEAYQRAIELNPSLALAYIARSHLLGVLGRTEAAITMAERAVELDPVAPSAHFVLAASLDLADRGEEASELYRAGLEAYPRSFQGHSLISDFHHARNGRFDQALVHLERALELAGEMPKALGVLGYVHGKTGRPAEARAVIDRLLELSSPRHTATALAFVHIGLDEHDEALRWLEAAYEEHDQTLVWLKEHWIFDPLRSSPRFERLLRRMQYPGV